jgi:cytochrome oxidase assembly protein ShyY1
VLSFLRRPKWIILGITIAVLATTFVGLSFWQLGRLESLRAKNRQILATRAQNVVPVATLMSPSGPPAAESEYRSVTATGHYDAAHEILVRGRAVTDHDGNFVLTPLITDSGIALLVNRGWVPPAAKADAEPAIPPAAAGTVTVVGRVRGPESGAARPATVGRYLSVVRIAPSALAGRVGVSTYDGYVELVSQTPPLAGAVPSLVPQGALDEGNHESYAFQWALFAVMAVGGYFLLAALEVRKRRRAKAPAGEPAVVS